MARVIDRVAVALFLAFLLAPVGSYVLSPSSLTVADARGSQLFNANPDVRDRIASNLVAESPYGAEIIRLKNAFDYYVVGFIETPTIVSGELPWLFYKPQFADGKCLPERLYETALNTIEAMRAVAAGAGIDMLVSVSPDKSVVYPDKLGPRGMVVAGCKLKSAAAWRAWAKQHGSSVMDHKDALLGALDAGIQVYDATDTHWNQVGFGYVIRQLADRLLNVPLPDPYSPELNRIATETGLRNRFLHLSEPEMQSELSDEWKDALRTRVSPGVYNAVIVHDSFYLRYVELLRPLFAEGRFFSTNHPQWTLAFEAIRARPNVLLVNSVERAFFARFTTPSQQFSWRGTLGKALLAANSDAARKCSFLEASKPEIETSGQDPAVTFSVPGTSGLVCIRIAYAGDTPVNGLLYLPRSEGEHEFARGYAIPLSGGNSRSFDLVLPASVSGRRLRLEPASGSSISLSNIDIAIGVPAEGS